MDPREPSQPFERFEVPEPLPSRSRSRTPTLITAAAVLIVAGLMNLMVVAAFGPSGSTAMVHIALGATQAVGAALILLLRPAGRALGVGLGVLGIVMGIANAGDNGVTSLMAVLLNAYVVYAMAISGPAFRRK